MAESEYDVVVAGGGPAGVAASVGAARSGADVALIERQDILGGAGTTNLVTNFLNAYWDGRRYIVGGVFMEIRLRLVGRKALYQTRGPCQGDKHGQEPFDPDAYADELEIMCREAGVDLQLGSAVTGVDVGGGHVDTIQLADRSSVRADAFVDATGDAALAHHAGVPTRIHGEDVDELQPLTFAYAVGPVDLDALEQEIPDAVMFDENVGERWADLSHLEASNRLIREAIAAGDVDLPIDEITSLRSLPGRPEQFAVNMGYVQVDDPTDEEQLAAATEEGRRQMEEGVGFLREYLPGFGDVEVTEEADRIGVRQSRRIEGRYELTEDDVLQCAQFDDVVAQSCFPIDIHRAEGDWEWDEEQFAEGEHYDIPLRTLIPRSGPSNVMVAGRSLSADHAAFSTARVSPTVIAMGEAAGVTTAMAVRDDDPIAEVDAGAVRDALVDAQAILE